MKKLLGFGAVVLIMTVVLLGCPTEASDDTTSSRPDETTDVVIVGGGLAGLASAIELQETSPTTKFILLERLDYTGSSSNVSGDATPAAYIPGTSAPELAFIGSSLDDLVNYYKAEDVYGGVNEPLLRKVYGPAAESFILRIIKDWKGLFHSSVGTYSDGTKGPGRNEYNSGPVFPRYGNGNKVYGTTFIGIEGMMFGGTEPESLADNYDGKTGWRIAEVLRAKLDAKQADLRLKNEVTKLIDEEGKIVGVHVKDLTTNEEYNITADAVILATGGVGGNLALAKKLAYEQYGDYVNLVSSRGPRGMDGAQGDAFTLTALLNVPVVGNMAIKFQEDNLVLLHASNLWVNQDGKRFVEEKWFHDRYYFEQMFGVWTARQNSWCYSIIDKGTYDGLEAEEKKAIDDAVAAGTVTKYTTLDALADDLGIDKTQLPITIASANTTPVWDYTANDNTGADITEVRVALDSSEFYAEKFYDYESSTSFVSIKTDDSLRVENSSGDVISGLYTAGDCAFANLFPKGINHKGQGTGVASYTGTLAAQTVLADINK